MALFLYLYEDAVWNTKREIVVIEQSNIYGIVSNKRKLLAKESERFLVYAEGNGENQTWHYQILICFSFSKSE